MKNSILNIIGDFCHGAFRQAYRRSHTIEPTIYFWTDNLKCCRNSFNLNGARGIWRQINKTASVGLVGTLLAFFVVSNALAVTLTAPPIKNPDDATQKVFLEKMTKYNELMPKLQAISEKSGGLIKVGPVIENGTGTGLIFVNPTIRDDIVGTVTDPTLNYGVTRGNQDPDKIGFSNQGRALLGAKFGSGTRKLLIVTQQHGNEILSTEAMLKTLERLSTQFANNGINDALENNIEVLVILRANPDGGEPDWDNCVHAEDNNYIPFLPPALTALPTTPNCGYGRFNIDPDAGGGFLEATEPGFGGSVGYGYDLNRYHYLNLDGPIRPVEGQAIVAAFIEFQPDYVLDIHGNQPRVQCTALTADEQNCADEQGNPIPGQTVDISVVAWSKGITEDEAVIKKQQKWGAIINDTVTSLGGMAARYRYPGILSAESSVLPSAAIEAGAIGITIEVRDLNDFLPIIKAVDEAGDLIYSGEFSHNDPTLINHKIMLTSHSIMASIINIADGVLDMPNDNGGFCTIGIEAYEFLYLNTLAKMLFQIPFESILGGPINQDPTIDGCD